ncbi:MAG: Alternative oxidase/tellurite resistance protein TehB [Parcubacteria group bacterium Gr01-1014_46]|nr:MAG: Alternative oxidase/tellurite resistance protein TehB [Parcubacteria group bacterium Gr01-1014_46]
MTQELVWDREYRNSKLLTKENKPQSDVVRFVKYLKKNSPKWNEGFRQSEASATTAQVLDLGSGAGRNSFYFAELGASVIGLEISKTAIEIAEGYIKNQNGLTYDISYVKQSIGEKFPVENDSVDIVLDVTSSNSLTEAEREIYLSESNRVLKPGGYFFVKALCLEGDSNAKFLVKNYSGKEKDTYTMPELGLTERVWSKEDFIKTYEKYFKIFSLERKTSYPRMNNRSYKRNFWIAYMTK